MADRVRSIFRMTWSKLELMGDKLLSGSARVSWLALRADYVPRLEATGSHSLPFPVGAMF